MEKLEKVLEKTKFLAEVVVMSMAGSAYEGLKKTEDKSYNGGTSIKYWM